MATDADDAVAVANRIGYPVLVRPSYVLGGRAMQIVYDDADLRRAMAELADTGSLGREGGLSAERPALIDRFLEDAIEVDVDALRDRTGEVRHRRRDGAHRGSRRALRRLRVRDPAADALGRRRRARSSSTRARSPTALEVVGSAQRAVRGEGRHGLRHRGEPAREPHGAVRQQGDRRAARQGRGAASWSARRFDELARRGLAAAAGRPAATSR